MGLIAFILGRDIEKTSRFALVSCLFLLAAPCVGFFVTSRYRYPSMALWSIFAGFALTTAVSHFRSGRKRVVWVMAACAFGFGAFSAKNILIRPNPLYAPHYERGFAYWELKQYPESLDNFKKAFHLSGSQGTYMRITRADIANKVGVIHNLQGEYDSASLYFDMSIELAGDYAIAYLNRGMTFLRQGRGHRAIADFSRALCLNVNDARLFPLYEQLLYEIMPSIEAIRDSLGICSNIHLQTIHSRYAAEMLIEQGDFARAREWVLASLQSDPNDPVTLVTLEYVRKKLTSDTTAFSVVMLSDRRENHARSLLAQGMQALQAGKTRYAKACFAWSGRFSESLESLYHRGLVDLHLGDLSSARTHLSQCLELRPGFVAAEILLDSIATRVRID